MNQIIIMYGKLEEKVYVVRIDELKLYFKDKYIDISKDDLNSLLNLLVYLKNEKDNTNLIDNVEYDILVRINGEETRYRGSNKNSLNKVIEWLGDLNVR